MRICRGCYSFCGSNLTEMGYCSKHKINLHECTEICDKYIEREKGKETVKKLINELMHDMSKKTNSYLIWFANNDSIQLDIIQDINRPNNPDDYEIIAEYINNNYGHVVYEIIEMESIDKIRL